MGVQEAKAFFSCVLGLWRVFSAVESIEAAVGLGNVASVLIS